MRCAGDASGRCSPSPSSYAAQTSMSIRRHRDGSTSSSSTHKEASNRGACKFTLQQLSAATDGFSDSNLIGEGGFGRVYKGHLHLDDDSGTPTSVAVKQLCRGRGGMQGSREFAIECGMLMALRHANIVTLIGYCAEGHERLLVYPFLPRRSLDSHLFLTVSLPGDDGRRRQPLDWNTRVKIARGTARALRYLHESVTPPVIYRDLKAANILLADDFTPRLSDLGLAKLGPAGDDTHVSTRVMGTHGYCAPDYAASGKLTVKSDVYSFGVVLLEIITGRRAFDAAREEEQRLLLVWAKPCLTDVRRGYNKLADPTLRGRYPRKALYQLAVVASLCLHDKPNLRPTMSEVTRAIDHVVSQPWHEPAVVVDQE
ncbi:probable serine/threonine-protein kinase PBL7 [Lolium rigidum]|uniref:probable serine/threonine-protein kinase PBL7 n=1 Tax=Lolium rigidum TaxID=89674 RepID=UPI001F5CD7A1|nr:probable serine/threonine-protein kinase PBL7 [Lolium rigidum]